MADNSDHEWSAESLFNKALLYASRMEGCPSDDPDQAFWSSLCLELLARASVAAISPTLLADPKDWRNINHALGRPTSTKKFRPRSVSTAVVFTIIHESVPAFRNELLISSLAHTERRNEELHTGSRPFESLRSSEWMPNFYESCEVLLSSLGKSLTDLFSNHSMATRQIQAKRDEAAKSVGADIARHQGLWLALSPEEQTLRTRRSELTSLRSVAHRVTCPACGNQALVFGEPHGEVHTEVDDSTVVLRQSMLPERFFCFGCELKVLGYSQLAAAGLGDVFTATTRKSAAEHFAAGSDDEEDYDFSLDDFND
jgi:ribosomal protein S27E